MAYQPQPKLFTVLGFVIWGDFADLTMYRSKRGKVVWFKKTWPDKPPSEKQLAWRDLWKTAIADWNALTPAARNQWDLASRRASLCMHGFDLWIHYSLSDDDTAIRTLERQTHTTLLPT